MPHPLRTALIALSTAAVGLSSTGPCDILAEAGNPCVAAHSTVRSLFGEYDGALYSVTRSSDNTTARVNAVGGVADAAAQDAFCEGTSCTVSCIFDQSPMGNDLGTAPGGPFYAPRPDAGVDATQAPLTVGGSAVYGSLFEGKMGYRNDTTTGVPVGDEAETMYVEKTLPLLLLLLILLRTHPSQVHGRRRNALQRSVLLRLR